MLMSRPRPPFASIHADLDPSIGAALATRERLELLAGLGRDCRYQAFFQLVGR
jgi:hypothetical protein